MRADVRGVLVFILRDRCGAVLDHSEHVRNDLRVKLGAADPLELADNEIRRQRLAVRPVARHRVIGVGHADNPRDERYLIALEARIIALSVDSLVVIFRALGDALDRGEFLENLSADLRVILNYLALLVGELAGLIENAVGYAYFADVVKLIDNTAAVKIAPVFLMIFLISCVPPCIFSVYFGSSYFEHKPLTYRQWFRYSLQKIP